ncbi:BTB/POZ domain-containing protein [Aspergillus brunneoviolaceus CBS 621.78]|uniref:Uncharacterized protein n=1 Tax=Aspergillus brunneoviolaceus CBS 621.78 TaxID=1450534 RepID=A0ACD1GFM5_9EURO|nr:hypothetical protein BO95DRAFT_480642 [Aspergillus brunneoviolaceus CBS 621.78]RAH47965.1 hypothetical protein BO95DRAFT_480642 [Aspergillus brunneoviolaceus CBS 621.78]
MTYSSKMLKDAQAKELCDLELECDGVRLTVHRIVVWNESEVIKTACKSNFMPKKEGRTNVIQIRDFSLATVKRMVQYMYLGDYTLKNDFRWASEVQEIAQPTVETILNPPTAATTDTQSDLICFTEAAPKTTASTPPTTAEALRPHLEMSMIAGYYMLPGLEALALKRIKTTASEQPWSPAGFDDLVSEVYPSIPHEATRGYLCTMVVEHLNDFPNNENLFPHLFSRQVISILKSFELEVSCLKLQKDHMERKFREMKANLEFINDICECRHCGEAFQSYIQLGGRNSSNCKLRCRECWTRHEPLA